MTKNCKMEKKNHQNWEKLAKLKKNIAKVIIHPNFKNIAQTKKHRQKPNKSSQQFFKFEKISKFKKNHQELKKSLD